MSSLIIAIVLVIIAGIITAFGGISSFFGILSIMGGGRGGLVALGIILFILGWVLLIASYYFYKKVLDTKTDTTDISSFETGGFLMFIGAILMISFAGVILIIIWIGF